MLKQIKTFNKVHKQDNVFDYDKCKKLHKELFNKVLKQIKTFNKVHKQDNVFDYDKCKKLHKELFDKVLIELLSTNNAGHKDSSANINKAHANDAKYEADSANNLLHNHILHYFNKTKKIEKALSKHIKHILTSSNKKYSDNRVKLSEFKKVSDKLNLLLEGICLFMFNKKIKKESIVENVNVLNNITEYTAIIDNKRVCLSDIYEHLDENINDIRENIKNKKYEKVLADLLLIQKHTFKSINRMRIHNVNKKITTANKANQESNKANKKITSTNSANKKITSTNSANDKITITNNANDKITSTNTANDKITSTNNANDKITSTNSANNKITNANNVNDKITNANNANKNITNGNNANNNSTSIIKKSSITIKLKRPYVIY